MCRTRVNVVDSPTLFGGRDGRSLRMPVRAVSFDVYSAMFDTVDGLTGALGAFFHQRGIVADAAATARAWRRAQMDYLLLANSLDRDPASNRAAIEASLRY